MIQTFNLTKKDSFEEHHENNITYINSIQQSQKKKKKFCDRPPNSVMSQKKVQCRDSPESKQL